MNRANGASNGLCTSTSRPVRGSPRSPEEWVHYDTIADRLVSRPPDYSTVAPYKEEIRWLAEREGPVVGDFGCGATKTRRATKKLDMLSAPRVGRVGRVLAKEPAGEAVSSQAKENNFTHRLREHLANDRPSRSRDAWTLGRQRRDEFGRGNLGRIRSC